MKSMPKQNMLVSPERNLQLLMVEDKPAEAELITAKLKRAGYSVSFEIVDSAKEYQRKLEQADYDIILCDHNLGSWTWMDALEILEQSAKEIPFVVVTTTLWDETAVENGKLGAADSVLKNRQERLPSVIDRALREIAIRKETVSLQAQNLIDKKDWEWTFDSIPDAVIVIGKTGHVERANRAAVKLLGWTDVSEVIGKACASIVHGQKAEPPECPHCLLRLTGHEEFATYSDERLGKILECSCSPMRDSNGAVTKSILVLRDVTERKKIEVAHTNLAQIVEFSDDAIIGKDLTSMVTSWNRGAAKLFGYTADEMVGRSIICLIPLDLRQEEEQILNRIKHGENVEPLETVRTRKDGHLIDVSVTVSPIMDATNKIVGASKIVRDITKRKRAEKSLVASEARYRRLFEAANDGILILDAGTGAIVDANPFLEKLLGFSHQEIFGKALWDIGLFKDIVESKSIFKQLQEHGQVRYESLPLESRNGIVRQVEFVGNMYEVDHSKVIQCNIRDITERFESAQLLREKAEMQEQMSNIIATIPGAVFSFQLQPNATSFFPFASSRFHDIFNLSPEDLERNAEVAFATVHPDYLPRLKTAIQDSFERMTPLHQEFRVQHPERGPLWVEIKALPARQPDGSILWHGIATDITERKTLESQYRQSQKMEALGQLTGGVAHDFNNLLGVILGNLDLLERLVADNEAAAKRVQTAQKAVLRGEDLTRRLLAFSHRQQLNPAPTRLDKSIQNVIAMASRVLGPEITIKMNLDKSVPLVFVDASGLENALLNLAVNARDAMPKGGSLTIATGLSDLEESYPPVQAGDIKPGRYARITLSDTGEGMSRETLQRVFEPFFTTKPRGKGTGLGLAMVYGFVKQSGGIVRIYSEMGQGTTVSFFLPLADHIPLPAPTVVDHDLRSKAGVTVLVVDDEVALLEIAVAYAEEMGCRVLQATDGPSALATVQREPGIELLLTDIIMPGGMNGVELAGKVRQLLPEIKVIYSSGFPSDALAESNGTTVDGPLLTKPYQRNDFVAAVRREIGRSDAGLEGGEA